MNAPRNSSKLFPAANASEVERLRSLLMPRASCPINTPGMIRSPYSMIKKRAKPSGKNIALVTDLKDTAIKKDSFPEKKYIVAKIMLFLAVFENFSSMFTGKDSGVGLFSFDLMFGYAEDS